MRSALVAATWITLAASIAVPAALADLKPKNTRVTMFLPPDESCGAFLRSERDGGSENRHWLAGYLTAFNQFGASDGNISSDTDWAGMWEWLRQRCERDPTLSFTNASFDLIEHLEDR